MELKQIPGTAGFLADDDGNIYSSDGQKRNTYRNGDGYVTASVKLVDGRWVTFGVHRLTALAHIPMPDYDSEETGEKYSEVNHRDCDLQNNKKTNLEWVTPSENNIHSEIMRVGNQYPTIQAVCVGVEGSVLFRNADEAELVTGVPKLKIWDGIRFGEFVQAPNHCSWRFWHHPWNGTIPTELKKTTLINRDSRGRAMERPIKLMNVDTGNILVFASMAEAARHFDTSPSHLYISIPKSEHVRLFRKQYQVAYADDDFPEISQEDLDRAKGHGPKDTVAYCAKDKITVLCSSAKELYELLKLSKKAVTTSLASGKIREISDGEKTWVVAYFTGQESINRLKAFAESPVSA